MWQLDKLKETLRFEKEGTRPEIGAARFGLSGFLKCAKPGLFFAHYRRFPHTMTNKVQNLTINGRSMGFELGTARFVSFFGKNNCVFFGSFACCV